MLCALNLDLLFHVRGQITVFNLSQDIWLLKLRAFKQQNPSLVIFGKEIVF